MMVVINEKLLAVRDNDDGPLMKNLKRIPLIAALASELLSGYLIETRRLWLHRPSSVGTAAHLLILLQKNHRFLLQGNAVMAHESRGRKLLTLFEVPSVSSIKDG